MQKCKVKSVKFIGKRKTYNLTMASSHHNYALFDNQSKYNIISSNSHSACYAYLSYTTAYLKANYPEEFMCSFLNVITRGSGDKFEKMEEFEKEFSKKMNTKFLQRDINRSKVEYVVEKSGDKNNGVKTEIRPSLICKGVGFKAAENIEKNQPFTDLNNFVEKIDTSIVDTRIVEALAIAGYWGRKHKKDPIGLVDKFSKIRDDRKKSLQKGFEPGSDIF